MIKCCFVWGQLSNWEYFVENLLLVNWNRSRSVFQYYAETSKAEIIVVRKIEKALYKAWRLKIYKQLTYLPHGAQSFLRR